MRTSLILAALAAIAAISAALLVYSGVYNPAATIQHTAPVYWLLTVAMRQSVKHRAEDIRVPALNDHAQIDNGFRLYRAHCEQCHGAPGVAPAAFALGMTPLPANLALTAREWGNSAELYWVVRYGIKMSGMPAWEFRLTDAELWNVVAFLNKLPGLSPEQYRGMTEVVAESALDPVNPGTAQSPGDADRGRMALQQYACVTCHIIPGVVGAAHSVGPSLAGIGERKYIAGTLANSRDTMIHWLRSPQAVAPGSAMPDLGVSERDARDIAAFLETLR